MPIQRQSQKSDTTAVTVLSRAEVPLPWSAAYVAHVIVGPLTYGLLSNCFWSGFPLHYVAMAWPLWRCGLALCVGFLVRLFARQLPIRVGPIGALPLAVLNLVTAILAVIYFNEEWAIFLEVVALLGLPALISLEDFVHKYFNDTQDHADDASADLISVFTLFTALSFTLGGVIFEYAGWQGVAVLHLSLQSIVSLILLVQAVESRHLSEVKVEPMPVVPEAPAGPAVVGKQGWELSSLEGGASGTPAAATGGTGDDPQQFERVSNLASNLDRASAMSEHSVSKRSVSSKLRIKNSLHSQLSRNPKFQERVTTKSTQGQDVNIDNFVAQSVVFRDLRPALASRAVPARLSLKFLGTHYMVPISILLLAGFALSFSLSIEYASYALIFRHNGFSVLALSLVQSAAELLPTLALTAKTNLLGDNEDEGLQLPACIDLLVKEPYNLSVTLCLLVTANVLLFVPSPAANVCGQLLVPSLYAVGGACLSDLFFIYSFMCEVEMIYSLELLNYSIEVFAASGAAVLAMSVLAEGFVDLWPYLISGSLTLLAFLILTIVFAVRVGGDLLTSEASREGA